MCILWAVKVVLLLLCIMEHASDAVNFNPLVIWFSNVGWLIGYVNRKGEREVILSPWFPRFYAYQSYSKDIVFILM